MPMLITNIGRLITMEPVGVIQNAAIEIEDGKIKSVIASKAKQSPKRNCGQEIASALRPRNDMQVIDAEGCVVIPGLIDCHTHLVHGGERVDEFAMRARGASYEAIAKAGGGIMSTVEATRAASENELLKTAKTRAHEALSHGITTIEVKSGYGLDLETELKMLCVVKRLNKELPIEFVPTFLGAHAVPPTSSRKDYVRFIIDKVLPAVARDELARFCDVFVEKIAFTKEEAKKILAAAFQLGLKPKLHADQLTSCGGAALAAKLKAVSADHLEHVTKKDMIAMAKANVVAVLIPSSTFFIGGNYSKARDMIKAGVKVAVSTDYNPGTSPILNLWLAASMGITQMKLTPEEAYQAITINAARALGMEKTHGSIAVGKVADLVILNTRNEFEPFYRFDRSFVAKVIKNGKVVHG